MTDTAERDEYGLTRAHRDKIRRAYRDGDYDVLQAMFERMDALIEERDALATRCRKLRLLLIFEAAGLASERERPIAEREGPSPPLQAERDAAAAGDAGRVTSYAARRAAGLQLECDVCRSELDIARVQLERAKALLRTAARDLNDFQAWRDGWLRLYENGSGAMTIEQESDNINKLLDAAPTSNNRWWRESAPLRFEPDRDTPDQ